MVVPDSVGRMGRAAGQVRRNVQMHVWYVLLRLCFF